MRYIVALYGYMVGTNYLLVFILLVFMYWKILRWIRILREQNRTLFILVFLERLFTAVFQEHAEVRLNTELLICFCWEARLKREREWSTSSQCSPSPDLEVCILPCWLIALTQLCLNAYPFTDFLLGYLFAIFESMRIHRGDWIIRTTAERDHLDAFPMVFYTIQVSDLWQ